MAAKIKMPLKLRKPIDHVGDKIAEIDIRLEDLSADDVDDVFADLRQRGHRDIMTPEADSRYLRAVAAKAAGVSYEALGELDSRDYVVVRTYVQDFFLGSEPEMVEEAEDPKGSAGSAAT